MSKKTKQEIEFSLTELRIIEMGATKVPVETIGRRIVRPLMSEIRSAFANSVSEQKELVEKHNRDFDKLIEKEVIKLQANEKKRLSALIDAEEDKSKKADMKKNLDVAVESFVSKKKAMLETETKEARTETINQALNQFFMKKMTKIKTDTQSFMYFVYNIWNKIEWGGGQESDQGLIQMVDKIDEKICVEFPNLNNDNGQELQQVEVIPPQE